MLKKCAYALVISLILLTGTLVAASSGLVVRSPLYGNTGVSNLASPLSIASYQEQLGLQQEVVKNDDERVRDAISASTYPVTPGDVYQLSYTNGNSRITQELQLAGDYILDIPGVDRIDATGLDFQALKQKVVALIASYYSYSSPILTLVGTGSFSVPVIGEVQSKYTYSVWGLSRLSSVVSVASPYASTRDVTITSMDGKSKSYDLYRAMREGALDQDPFLRPGDVVTLKKADRMITLSGAVRRQGTCQPLEDESFTDIITKYGGGVLPGADIQHMRLRRFSGSAWQTVYVNLLEDSSIPLLLSMDQVMVDTISEKLASMTIEGAIRSEEADDPTNSTALLGQSSGRIFYQFYPGETLDKLLETVSGRFKTVSDLENAYLKRGGDRIPVDVSKILVGNAESGIYLQKDDVLVIPFTQRFVNVSGAVTRSGVYAYVPDKKVDYYLAIAGGATKAASKPLKVTMTDKLGNVLDKDAFVPEESTINVKENTFVSDLAPTVAVLGLVSSVISIVYNIVLTMHYVNN